MVGTASPPFSTKIMFDLKHWVMSSHDEQSVEACLTRYVVVDGSPQWSKTHSLGYGTTGLGIVVYHLDN